MNEEKVSGLEGAVALRERLDSESRRLVFTNGCFDVLHAGHVRYLARARELGDALVIGLNGDASVRSLKGPGRPIDPADDREEVLLALGAVDGVVVFEDERATGLIDSLRPHVYAKGGDYTVDSLNREERAALERAGTRIEILPLVEGRSTSATLAKMKSPDPDRRVRLGVLGSGRGSNFESVLRAIDRGELEAEVAIVLSDNRDARILETAAERGIETAWVDPGRFKTKFPESAQKEACDRLRAAGVDLVVLAGFMRLVKEPLLSQFQGRIINIHPSLLPAFKGLEAWRQALEAGVEETGCTVHFVTEEMDAGEVIDQARVPVLPGDDPATLHARIQEQEHRILPIAVAQVAREILGAPR